MKELRHLSRHVTGAVRCDDETMMLRTCVLVVAIAARSCPVFFDNRIRSRQIKDLYSSCESSLRPPIPSFLLFAVTVAVTMIRPSKEK
mmetsp:Transcript_66243/g.74185  ORF Transcript_66243/g.74185 Transcript_66243/m.74185 type:complete len:88 (-) Transcript_66243:65-328(-)